MRTPPPVSLVARTWNVVRVVFVCSIALIALLAQSPAAQAQSLAGCSNPNVTGGGSCAAGPVVLSSHDQAMLAAKSRLADEMVAMLHGKVSAAKFHSDLVAYAMSLPEPARLFALSRANAPAPFCITPPGGGGCVPSAKYVSLTQQPQQQWYYCGPAAASEILAALGASDSQSYVAGSYSTPTWLGTNYYGQTSWGPAVMAPTLNSLQSRLVYWTQNGGSGAGMSASQWSGDLLTDIYDYNQPIAGNTVEYGGSGPYLTGHNAAPSYDFPLYHWIAIYGYTSYGNNTAYADSISGDTGIWPWAQYVPAYSTISSSNMYTLLSTMGWVW